MHKFTLLFLYALLVDGVAAVIDDVSLVTRGSSTGLAGWVSLCVL